MPMDRENRPARPGAPRKRRKVCQFCVDKCEHIDYKDAAKLRRFISERSKILPRLNKLPSPVQMERGRSLPVPLSFKEDRLFQLFQPLQLPLSQNSSIAALN